MFDITVRKNGQSRYMRCSMLTRAASVPNASKAAPAPYHPGNRMRHWLQLNTHGIARRSSMRSDAVREAGRLPTVIELISRTGVMARKRVTKPGVSYTRLRYAFSDAADSSSMAVANAASCAASVTPSAVAMAVAETSASRLRRA